MNTKCDIFVCPDCQSARLIIKEAPDPHVRCDACSSVFSQVNGIIDFVRGATVTALDDINYDDFYKIDNKSSRNYFMSISKAHGHLIFSRATGFMEPISQAQLDFAHAMAPGRLPRLAE